MNWPMQRKILAEVVSELDRQVERWGIQDHPLTTWLEPKNWHFAAENMKVMFSTMKENHSNPGWDLIMMEEVAEAFAETDLEKARAELIQVAAVAISAIENIDRRLSE